MRLTLVAHLVVLPEQVGSDRVGNARKQVFVARRPLGPPRFWRQSLMILSTLSMYPLISMLTALANALSVPTTDQAVHPKGEHATGKQ